MHQELIPTFDQVRRLPSQDSATVLPEWIDVNGHMNIKHYLDLGSMTTVRGVETCGIDQRYRDGERASLFNVENHLVYLAESHLGDELTGHLRYVDVGPKSLHTVALIIDPKRELVVNVYESLGVHVDMDTRRARDFPPHVYTQLAAKVRQDAQLDWPAPVSGAMAVRGGLRAVQAEQA